VEDSEVLTMSPKRVSSLATKQVQHPLKHTEKSDTVSRVFSRETTVLSFFLTLTCYPTSCVSTQDTDLLLVGGG